MTKYQDKKILVVEDDEAIVEPTVNFLQKLGFIITGIAQSGEEAVESVRNDRPDLVLMDIILVGAMTGIQAGEQIIREFNVPIIYMTGYAEKVTELQKKGEVPILKPFQISDLKCAIDLVFYRKNIGDSL